MLVQAASPSFSSSAFLFHKTFALSDAIVGIFFIRKSLKNFLMKPMGVRRGALASGLASPEIWEGAKCLIFGE